MKAVFNDKQWLATLGNEQHEGAAPDDGGGFAEALGKLTHDDAGEARPQAKLAGAWLLGGSAAPLAYEPPSESHAVPAHAAPASGTMGAAWPGSPAALLRALAAEPRAHGEGAACGPEGPEIPWAAPGACSTPEGALSDLVESLRAPLAAEADEPVDTACAADALAQALCAPPPAIAPTPIPDASAQGAPLHARASGLPSGASLEHFAASAAAHVAGDPLAYLPVPVRIENLCVEAPHPENAGAPGALPHGETRLPAATGVLPSGTHGLSASSVHGPGPAREGSVAHAHDLALSTPLSAPLTSESPNGAALTAQPNAAPRVSDAAPHAAAELHTSINTPTVAADQSDDGMARVTTASVAPRARATEAAAAPASADAAQHATKPGPPSAPVLPTSAADAKAPLPKPRSPESAPLAARSSLAPQWPPRGSLGKPPARRTTDDAVLPPRAQPPLPSASAPASGPAPSPHVGSAPLPEPLAAAPLASPASPASSSGFGAAGASPEAPALSGVEGGTSSLPTPAAAPPSSAVAQGRDGGSQAVAASSALPTSSSSPAASATPVGSETSALPAARPEPPTDHVKGLTERETYAPVHPYGMRSVDDAVAGVIEAARLLKDANSSAGPESHGGTPASAGTTAAPVGPSAAPAGLTPDARPAMLFEAITAGAEESAEPTKARDTRDPSDATSQDTADLGLQADSSQHFGGMTQQGGEQRGAGQGEALPQAPEPGLPLPSDVQDAADAIWLRGQGPKAAAVSVQHPELGTMNLVVQQEAGRVEVRAVLDTPKAAVILRAQESAIKYGLQQAGMTLSSLRVKTREETETPRARELAKRRRTDGWEA